VTQPANQTRNLYDVGRVKGQGNTHLFVGVHELQDLLTTSVEIGGRIFLEFYKMKIQRLKAFILFKVVDPDITGHQAFIALYHLPEYLVPQSPCCHILVVHFQDNIQRLQSEL